MRFANLDRVGHHIVTGDGNVAVRGGQVAREDPHGRAFSGAVRAEEAHDFAFVDLEADAFHGVEAAVILGQIIYFDHGTGENGKKRIAMLVEIWTPPGVKNIAQLFHTCNCLATLQADFHSRFGKQVSLHFVFGRRGIS